MKIKNYIVIRKLRKLKIGKEFSINYNNKILKLKREKVNNLFFKKGVKYNG